MAMWREKVRRLDEKYLIGAARICNANDNFVAPPVPLAVEFH